MVFCYSSLNELKQPKCNSLVNMKLISQYILIDTCYLSIIILGSGVIGITKTNDVPNFHKLTF